MKPYHEHLRGLVLDRSSDLWRFFADGFFHDGGVTNLRVDDAMHELWFSVDCPNIRHRIGSDFEYVNASFECAFFGIAHLSINARRFDELNDPLSPRESSVTFDRSEIDTLETELREAKASFGREFHSLVIETMPCTRFLQLVFESVAVLADDKARFDEFCKSPDYLVPWAGREL
jgi:hypothetical protein